MSYTKDGAETTLDKAIETAVPSEGVTLTYKIDASKVTTADIAADAVDVLAAGDVTVGEIQKSADESESEAVSTPPAMLAYAEPLTIEYSTE